MKKQLKKFALAATLGLTLAFTFNCSSGNYIDGDEPGGSGGVTGGADGGGNKNSQVYNEDSSLYTGSGVIKFRAGYEDEDRKNKIFIDVGSLTNGKVNLQLPSTIDSKYLKELFDEKDLEKEGCTEYPKGGIKELDDERFYLTSSNGEEIGKLMLVSGRQAIFYAYFSKAGKITCNNITINAKAGWNKLYFIDGHPDKVSTDNILTEEVRWTFFPTEK